LFLYLAITVMLWFKISCRYFIL